MEFAAAFASLSWLFVRFRHSSHIANDTFKDFTHLLSLFTVIALSRHSGLVGLRDDLMTSPKKKKRRNSYVERRHLRRENFHLAVARVRGAAAAAASFK